MVYVLYLGLFFGRLTSKLCIRVDIWTEGFGIAQPKRVKLTNHGQFLSLKFFGLDFHHYVIFLPIGIGQLDNDV